MTQPDIPSAPAAASAEEIHKRFGSTHALRGVGLSLQGGRCLGLVGRNGAGKSTLISILSGLVPPDAGEVRFDGQLAPSLGDVAAWRGRIATVFQHSMVVPGLTVAENVFLGRQPRHGPGLVDWRRMREQARKIMADWGFDVAADTPCGSLTVEQRQVVEITRALAAGTRCLLLDEPTAALERGAAQRLFARVRQLREAGVAIMYISHHLEEVFEICTDVAVLRDGELVLTAPMTQVGKDDLVTAMVGERGQITIPNGPGRLPRGPVQPRPGRPAGARRAHPTWSSARSAWRRPARPCPALIVAITPTRGVDVASKELLLAELDRITRQTGVSLLLASDELDDLGICDRVLVLVRGEIFTEFTEPPFDREALIAATEGLGVSS